MKITDLNASGINGLSSGAVTSVGIGSYGRNARSAYGSGSDQVQLSGASRLASSALAAHGARLAELKRAVSSGEYHPPADAIGRSLLADTLSRSR